MVTCVHLKGAPESEGDMPMKRALPAVIAAAALCLVVTACEGDQAGVEASVVDRTSQNAAIVVEITAIHDHETGQHLFRLASHTIDSGWTTFRLVNASPHEHFALLAKLPADDGRYDDPVNLETWQAQVTVPFQEAMNNIIDPEIDDEAVFAPFAALPDWFGDIEHAGGPGFIRPGHTAETTVYLSPGTYLMECYVKDEEEQFHSYLGMLEQITVNDTPSNAPEPQADVTLTLSSEEGITVDGDLAAGTHTIAVHFEDQTVYEHMVGHDVHLVRLNGTEVETVARWMNWMVPGSLVAPAPGIFLGGAQMMTAGQTAYFTVDLEPGEYAWIAEVPADHEMWHTFTVR
jgi:uncharacterized cupredoxin-like copper-binding protein